MENTKAIIKELQTSDSNNLVVVLISGGGSALLCCPVDGVTLDEKVRLTRLVAGAGASIEELNKCRIMLSQVKGGKLAQLAYPAKVIHTYVCTKCLSFYENKKVVLISISNKDEMTPKIRPCYQMFFL